MHDAQENPPANREQAALWNGVSGHAWVEAQALLDHIFKSFEDLLVEAVAASSASRVLDIGCGTGGVTLAVARMLDGMGKSTGVDISEPMITAARARAERLRLAADFVRADAQNHAFAPASFDMIISRFGVMFFEDPVKAFANLRRAASDDAHLCVIAYRSLAENAFMTTAERAAAPLLPAIPARTPDAPGQFAFADQDRVKHILMASGWTAIDIRPIDVSCHFPEPELVRYFTQLGPLGRALHEADEQTRAQIIATVRAAFDPFVHGADVRFNAACWRIGASARSPARS